MKSLIKVTDKSDVLASAKPICMSPIAIRAILDGRKKTERICASEFAMSGGLSREWLNREGINPLNLKEFDVLYVQEDWAIDSRLEGNTEGKRPYIYRASTFINPLIDWQPAETMTADKARIFLFVYRIALEPLQSINGQGRHDDVLNEGYPFECKVENIPPLAIFEEYWDRQALDNNEVNHMWAANPFVWVLHFATIDVWGEEDDAERNAS